ncbi:hypothetical protein [Mesoterricola sediminis]|uniref:Uncharacterized protein n=1 Tax=Mesoterricola sediminis TaxID=2927980 RepID=A0AA48GY58_9BACT|nr:hypothetical protein [Mesoterricola sediminis]BDU76560.1 hypothetical protein METESE_15180 [Mesoterricola sediminis]
MRVFARVNQIGWVHLWPTREAYEAGEASIHFFNGRTDPRWAEAGLEPAQREALGRGELVELEDPGYLEDPGAPSGV